MIKLSDPSKNNRSLPILVLDTDYSRMDGTIEETLEIFSSSWKGRRVVIKPNILGPHPPEKGVTTHPALIRSLVKCLKKMGAICLVGDNPGLNGYTANEQCARVSGIYDAAGDCFVNFAKETMQVNVKSRFFQKLVISKPILAADLVINVPKFKTHLQTRITGAIKNMFGILVGAEKARVHLVAARSENFAEALVDIYQIRPPDLTIMDAVVGMEGNGPSSGGLRPIGKVLASENGVSLDALMAAMMGLDPGKVDLLRIASRRGLGQIDPAKMEIRGTWPRLPKFKMPLTFVSRGLFGAAVNRLFYRPLVRPHIAVNPDLCTQCGTCIQHCPAKALTMQEVPCLDKEKCISCYCCYELCSYQAIELTGLMRWMARGVSRK